jgi:hypothetical protein
LAADPDITRAAKFMIELHGEHAWPSAISRAKNLLARGQEEASAIWLQIAKEIARLRHVRTEQAGRK